jgi:hypothetical protein
MAPAEVPMKKSNFSCVAIPISFSRCFRNVMDAKVLTPPPSMESKYLMFKLDFFNFED